MKSWRSSPFVDTGARKINRDREGRPLPASIEPAGWALLRQLEKDKAKRDAKRLDELNSKKREAAEIKREAKAANR